MVFFIARNILQHRCHMHFGICLIARLIVNTWWCWPFKHNSVNRSIMVRMCLIWFNIYNCNVANDDEPSKNSMQGKLPGISNLNFWLSIFIKLLNNYPLIRVFFPISEDMASISSHRLIELYCTRNARTYYERIACQTFHILKDDKSFILMAWSLQDCCTIIK